MACLKFIFKKKKKSTEVLICVGKPWGLKMFEKMHLIENLLALIQKETKLLNYRRIYK